MPIRFNPGCPCCWVVSIAAGVYCTRWKCIEQENPHDPGTKYYVTKGEFYFPPQTISLYRLGFGANHVVFTADEKLIDTASIDEELVFTGNMGPPLNYMGQQWVAEDGDLDVPAIEADMNKNNKPDDPVKTLGDWPPMFLFAQDGVDANTWYKLVFDLGKYGKVEKIFFVSGNDYIAHHYYIMNPESFPIQGNPGDPPLKPNQPPVNQNLDYRCCPPCIVNYKEDMVLNVEYTEIDTSSYSIDVCWGCCWSWWYYPYITIEDCKEEAEKHPLSHADIQWIDPKTKLTVSCKWDGYSWVSDPVLLYTNKEVISYYYNNCTWSYTQKYFVTFTVSCYGGTSSCSSSGDVLAYTIYSTLSLVTENIDIPCEPSWQEAPCTGFSCCSTWCCNIVGSACCGKSYGFFGASIVNPQCEPLRGKLTEFVGDKDKGCSAGNKGDISGG